jgi:hypothetical protein
LRSMSTCGSTMAATRGKCALRRSIRIEIIGFA